MGLKKDSKKDNRKKNKKGGACGCACGSGAGSNPNPPKMMDFKSIMGGTTEFQSNGMPANAIPYADNGAYTDPQRMMTSGRFLNGGKSRRRLGKKKAVKKGSKKNATKKNTKKDKKRRGGSWFGNDDPLAGNQDNVVSAFGNTSGAALNAKLAAGVPIDPLPKSGIFANSSTKPMV